MSEEEKVQTHHDFHGERCPVCHKNRLRFRKKSPSPAWLQRYGHLQLYVCDGCKTKFVVQDARVEPIRRCNHCAQWFIPRKPKSRCCNDDCAQAYRQYCIEQVAEGKRIKEAIRNGEEVDIDL